MALCSFPVLSVEACQLSLMVAPAGMSAVPAIAGALSCLADHPHLCRLKLRLIAPHCCLPAFTQMRGQSAAWRRVGPKGGAGSAAKAVNSKDWLTRQIVGKGLGIKGWR